MAERQPLTYRFTDYCVCPQCQGDLRERHESLQCTRCGVEYEIRDGIPMLLPRYATNQQARYFDCYQTIAKDDLEQPMEPRRDARHAVFLKFIANVKNKKVLDIGSSNALYLRGIDAGFKVALDIAIPYLTALSESDGIARLCGDAEYLPVKPGFFDVIIVSDILEHLLNPDRLVHHLRRICERQTRLIVHVPWEEELTQYQKGEYEFTHLRAFNAYLFAELWRGFYVKRKRASFPSLHVPIVFTLDGKIPRALYNALVHMFFETDLWKRDSEWRARWFNELPKRERWLLWFYKPTYRIFELRLVKRSVWAYAFWKIYQAGRWFFGHR